MCRLTSIVARWLIAVAILAAAVPSTGFAQTSGRAGLVVVHGDGRQSFVIVQFDGKSIPTVDVLERSGLEVTEVNFGALGMGICDIDGTGCDVATCRKRVCQGPKPDDPFWKLFIRTDEGTWQASPLGISYESLSDGDVRALVWTGAEPDIPAFTIDEIAARAGSLSQDGVALTRYGPDGDILTTAEEDDGGVPFAALAAVALAAIAAVVLVVRRQAVTR